MATPDTGLSEQAVLNRVFDSSNNALIVSPSITVSTSLGLTVANTTGSLPIFRITGGVEVRGLYGVVTTVFSSNVTAAYWRLNDQTATVDLTLNTGVSLSNSAVGTIVTRRSVASVAMVKIDAAAGALSDPVASTAPAYFMPFVLNQKTGGVQTDVEFTYTTINNPSSGRITFYMRYVPLTPGATVTGVAV